MNAEPGTFGGDVTWLPRRIEARPVDARVSWARFGLVVLGCAVGGAGVAYLVCAVVLDKILNVKGR